MLLQYVTHKRLKLLLAFAILLVFPILDLLRCAGLFNELGHLLSRRVVSFRVVGCHISRLLLNTYPFTEYGRTFFRLALSDDTFPLHAFEVDQIFLFHLE